MGTPLPGKGLSTLYHWSAAPQSIQEVFLVADARPARTPALWVMLCPSMDLAWSLGGILGVPKSGVWVRGGGRGTEKPRHGAGDRVSHQGHSR